jgi:excisionase family DNA binding protein
MATVLDAAPVADRPAQLLLTFAEAGDRLMVSGRQVRILVDEGQIRSVHIGRLHRVALDDLEAYVEQLRAAGR